MTNIVNCKANERESQRFWSVQERLFTIPLSEKQSTHVLGGIYLDT